MTSSTTCLDGLRYVSVPSVDRSLRQSLRDPGSTRPLHVTVSVTSCVPARYGRPEGSPGHLSSPSSTSWVLPSRNTIRPRRSFRHRETPRPDPKAGDMVSTETSTGFRSEFLTDADTPPDSLRLSPFCRSGNLHGDSTILLTGTLDCVRGHGSSFFVENENKNSRR